MTKQPQLTKRQRRALDQAHHERNGGLIQVSFTFNGKKHMESHRLSASELAAQATMLKQHGLRALEESSVVQMAVTSARLLGHHVVTEAFKEFIRENWSPTGDEVTTQDVVEELARRNGVVLTKTQTDAVDDTAGIQSEERVVVHQENGKVTSVTHVTEGPYDPNALPSTENADANPQRIPTI